MALDDVGVRLEYETASSVCHDSHFIACLKAGLPQRLHRDGCLMLGADTGEAPPPIPYFLHWK